ncbi:MAG: GNAT family N-acetyltransferase [Hominenteromicrobium sp.]
MNYTFQNFHVSDYEKVRDFLVELSGEDRTHINWNWARWEWMFFHPEFDRASMEKIGLWFSGEDLVGAAIYDHYFGEAFFAAKKGFEELEKDILDYMVENFSDENGLGIAVNDRDTRTMALMTSYGFLANEQTENILELSLNEFDFGSSPSGDITIGNIDPEKDLYKHHELLWKGFDHEGDAPLDEDTLSRQKVMLSAPHLNARLHAVAQNERSEYVSYCGLWYDPSTDYAYVEPVCTIPEYRGKGLAKCVLTEALKRAYDLGAEKAYVISDMEFYKRLGFRQYAHYTFYWYNK